MLTIYGQYKLRFLTQNITVICNLKKTINYSINNYTHEKKLILKNTKIIVPTTIVIRRV